MEAEYNHAIARAIVDLNNAGFDVTSLGNYIRSEYPRSEDGQSYLPKGDQIVSNCELVAVHCQELVTFLQKNVIASPSSKLTRKQRNVLTRHFLTITWALDFLESLIPQNRSGDLRKLEQMRSLISQRAQALGCIS